MTTKVKASRFRIRRTEPSQAAQPPAARDDDMLLPADDGFGPEPFPTARAAAPAPAPSDPATQTAIDAIRREGLTGRQLRLARRVAMKNGLPATSDFDAVRLLRVAGIDPFQRNSLLELVASGGQPSPEMSRLVQQSPGDGNRLPHTAKPLAVQTTGQRAEQNLAADVMKIQRDIAQRRPTNRGSRRLLETLHANRICLPTALRRSKHRALWPSTPSTVGV